MSDSPDALRKRIDELRAILRGLTDLRAVEVVKDEITALEAKAGRSPTTPKRRLS